MSKPIEELFLETKEIFAKQAKEAVEEALDKIYTKYLPHVENDTMSNVYFQSWGWLEKFFAGALQDDDMKIDLTRSGWTEKAARQKMYEENKEEIQAAIGRDLQDKIDSMRRNGWHDTSYSPYQ
jgi:hypothetical protein